MDEGNVATRGGGFLLASLQPQDVRTPEQFTEEQVMIGRAAETYVAEKVLPRIDEIESGDHQVTVELLREAGRLGLLGGDVPEAYGGLGLNKVATTLITEKFSRAGSFAVSFGAHTGIGTLPIVFFGDEAQKARYLPDLASGEKLAAYALTEPDAGSDALGGKTVARLSDDGRVYRLSGQKQWITNSGFADLFVVYAKVDGDKMTAFLVERDAEGLQIGPEIEKMGIQGSSTCMLYLDDTPVPAENVLGEVGRGHVVAFNILNLGRWKLAAACVGSCKALVETSARYALQRRQFGRSIAEFTAIQQKLAHMACRTFVLESMVYRTAGLFDQALAPFEAGGDAGGEAAARAIGEYAVEASINKVFGSETLDFVVDETVQIHGGYGYVKEFGIERAYRDARINRIFEGTNEINRLLITGTLLRRAMKGELPLLEAIQRVQEEVSAWASGVAGDPDPGPTGTEAGPLDREYAQLANAKRATLLVSGAGGQKYLDRVEDEQEFLLAVGDLVILVFAWESGLLRASQALQHFGDDGAAPSVDMARLFADWAADQAELIARRAVAGMERGDALEKQLAVVRRLFQRTPADGVELGRRVGQRVLAAEGYLAIDAASPARPATVATP